MKKIYPRTKPELSYRENGKETLKPFRSLCHVPHNEESQPDGYAKNQLTIA